MCPSPRSAFFFFNDTATTEIYTLSLHDALPISPKQSGGRVHVYAHVRRPAPVQLKAVSKIDRKSTRLNSSHQIISYAVFCLKKKKKKDEIQPHHIRRPNTQKIRQTRQPEL